MNDEKLALVCLNMLPGIGPVKAAMLIRSFGSASAALLAPRGDLEHLKGIGSKLASTLIHWQEYADPETEVLRAEKAGIQIITRNCPQFPLALKDLYDSPLLLYVRGNCDALQDYDRSVAIVGTRRPSNYGERMAAQLSCEAAALGWKVVSGLAHGIDSIAHQSCLKASGQTIAVLGSGMGKMYPQSNVRLAQEICASEGAVISECPILTPPDKWIFPMRNRIVSGLSRCILVVEAASRSGTLITVNHGLEQGRSIYAVPGRADCPQARSCNELIRQGAVLTENFTDVINDLELLPFSKNTARPPSNSADTQDKPSNSLQLSDEEERIVSILKRGEENIETILDGCEMPPAQIYSTLLTLETKRVVRLLPGRMYELANPFN